MDLYPHISAKTSFPAFLKGTVSVISSNPLCKNGNARFTNLPLKALSDQVWNRYSCFGSSKLICSCGFSAKVTCTVLNRIYGFKGPVSNLVLASSRGG